jgi:hypothetical protein
MQRQMNRIRKKAPSTNKKKCEEWISYDSNCNKWPKSKEVIKIVIKQSVDAIVIVIGALRCH